MHNQKHLIAFNMNFNIPFWISRKVNVFFLYFKNMTTQIIPPMMRLRERVVDNIQINSVSLVAWDLDWTVQNNPKQFSRFWLYLGTIYLHWHQANNLMIWFKQSNQWSPLQHSIAMKLCKCNSPYYMVTIPMP
jgi:hypothetical protein